MPSNRLSEYTEKTYDIQGNYSLDRYPSIPDGRALAKRIQDNPSSEKPKTVDLPQLIRISNIRVPNIQIPNVLIPDLQFYQYQLNSLIRSSEKSHPIERIEKGNLSSGEFQDFLIKLETETLAPHQKEYCEALSVLIDRVIDGLDEGSVQNDQEMYVFGCPLRTFTFNTNDNELSQIAKKLENATAAREKKRSFADGIEMMISQAVMGRFQARPIPYDESFDSLHKACLNTLKSLRENNAITSKDKNAGTFVYAFLSVLCYRDPRKDDDLRNELDQYLELIREKKLVRFLKYSTERLQTGIDRHSDIEREDWNVLKLIRSFFPE